MKKLLTFALIIVSIATSCKEPKSKTVVNHIVQSIDTSLKWNPTIQRMEPIYVYHYIDGDSVRMAADRIKIGDTIPYIYYKY
jgi:hypothetical protein